MEQTATENQNKLYPVFLKLEELDLLLVGAGQAGLEMLRSLLSNSPDARIRVVGTGYSHATEQLLQQHPSCSLEKRPFEESDLDNRDLVILASDDGVQNRQIRSAAEKRGILVHVEGRPELSDFYLGHVVQKGNLKIAISTNEKSPAAGSRLGEVLQDALPAQLDEVIENLHRVKGKLNGNFETRVKKLNAITKILVEKETIGTERRWKKIATWFLLAFAFMLVGHFIFSYIPFRRIADDTVAWYHTLDKNFPWIVLAGFLAQLVDGSLGMGYGVTSATILLSSGINPAAISGSIHTAEVFSSAASGYSHYKFRNVNKKLFRALVIPGVIGAAAGAILLTWLGNADTVWLRGLLAAYTLFLGIKFLFNAFRKPKPQKKFRHYSALAGAGGFVDSFGGGGWGPLVTTTLINKGRSPRYVIGSVSLTEFFVTLTSAFTFFTLLGVSHWQVILALVTGGVVAAPLAAKLAGRMPRKTAFILLGILVIIWSLRILVKFIG